jgi:hypothetical protein
VDALDQAPQLRHESEFPASTSKTLSCSVSCSSSRHLYQSYRRFTVIPARSIGRLRPSDPCLSRHVGSARLDTGIRAYQHAWSRPAGSASMLGERSASSTQPGLNTRPSRVERSATGMTTGRVQRARLDYICASGHWKPAVGSGAVSTRPGVEDKGARRTGRRESNIEPWPNTRNRAICGLKNQAKGDVASRYRSMSYTARLVRCHEIGCMVSRGVTTHRLETDYVTNRCDMNPNVLDGRRPARGLTLAAIAVSRLLR